MDKLRVLHNLENYLGYDLDEDDGDRVIEYLDDEYPSTCPRYLSELFGFEVEHHPDPENIYGLASIQQSIEVDRK